MKLIDCKPIRAEILEDAKAGVEKIVADYGKKPKLVIVSVDGDDASKVYVRNKLKTADEVGIECEHINLPNDVSYSELEKALIEHAIDSNTTALMLQLPLPNHLTKYQQKLLDLVPYFKDVDGLSTASVGRLWSDQPCLVPCTAAGIMRILPEDLSGYKVCIINRSALIGKPLAKLVLSRNGTPVICHSKTHSILGEANHSDILVTAMGKPKYIEYDEWLDDLMIIDAAICRDEEGKLCGDIDIETFKESNCSITPVPGSVGLLTTSQLMLNVVQAFYLQHNYEQLTLF